MKPTKGQAKEFLQEALKEIPALRDYRPSSEKFKSWRRNTFITIRNIFGRDSTQVTEFLRVKYDAVSDHPATWDPKGRGYQLGLDEVSGLVVSLIAEVDRWWEDDVQTSPQAGPPNVNDALVSNQVFVVHGRDEATKQNDTQPQTLADQPSVDEPIASNRVFVVHGRDEAAKHMVARYLEELGLEPVILREQPSQGRTIIEKFEEESQTVGFAVVLGTPDDIGALAIDKDNLRPRMRQNVVLELGYFAGKLGRKRVCVLLKGDVERPSDYDGVIYIPFDDGEGWKLTLGRELRDAGFTVDLNRL